MEDETVPEPVTEYTNYIKYGMEFKEYLFPTFEEATRYIIPGLETARSVVATVDVEIAPLVVPENQRVRNKVPLEVSETERLIQQNRIIDDFTEYVTKIERCVLNGGNWAILSKLAVSLADLDNRCKAFILDLDGVEKKRSQDTRIRALGLGFVAMLLPVVFKGCVEYLKFIDKETEEREQKAKEEKRLEQILKSPSLHFPPAPAPARAPRSLSDWLGPLLVILATLDAFLGVMPFLIQLLWKSMVTDKKKEQKRNQKQKLSVEYVKRATHIIGRSISASLIPALPSEPNTHEHIIHILDDGSRKDDVIQQTNHSSSKASFIGFGAIAIADLVKTNLGPQGTYKVLQSTGPGHIVTVTSDGATILKSLHIDNASAKVLVDISKVQDNEFGDGTTSVVVLAGELLREAEKLVNAKIDQKSIISGYRMAAKCARDALLDKVVDNKLDKEKFKSDLMKIAMTTLSSEILSQDKEHFATLAVDAVMRVNGSTNLESILIIKKTGGSLKDSFLDEGFILDKTIGVGQLKRIENAKILVANTAMVANNEAAEKDKISEIWRKVKAMKGINCFVCRQLMNKFPGEAFADVGVLAIEDADFDGIERLALVTGGEIASTFDHPESVKLGKCKVIKEIMVGEDNLIHFSGVEMGQACTIVVRGASPQMLDEAERSLHNALCVLSQMVIDGRVLLGGGWPEMVMGKAVDGLARRTQEESSHAIEAFSRALVAIPTFIADNAGMDSAELIAKLRAEHHKEGSTAGIDVISGDVGDMAERGICEAFIVKQAVLVKAAEAAEMILKG